MHMQMCLHENYQDHSIQAIYQDSHNHHDKENYYPCHRYCEDYVPMQDFLIVLCLLISQHDLAQTNCPDQEIEQCLSLPDAKIQHICDVHRIHQHPCCVLDTQHL